MDIPIGISGVCERDIDLLLLEEFIASAGFRSWFLRQIGISDIADVVAVARSVTTSNGESDLEFTLRRDSHLLRILIENKVDAVFQPRQPTRYRERAESYLKSGEYAEVRTVIVAPADYLANKDACSDFDCRITYESILQWLGTSADQNERMHYKRTLISSAIDRSSSGWRLIEDTTVTEFWKQYWAMADTLASELRMPKPTQKPATSWFVYFRPLGLGTGVSLVHKLPYGHVDLQFSQMGTRFGELEHRYGNALGPDMRVTRANKSAVIRIEVPQVDVRARFEIEEVSIRQALDAALRLLDCYKAVPGHA